jgi:hypothetical protein
MNFKRLGALEFPLKEVLYIPLHALAETERKRFSSLFLNLKTRPLNSQLREVFANQQEPNCDNDRRVSNLYVIILEKTKGYFKHFRLCAVAVFARKVK